MAIPADTLHAQSTASNPANSAWVSANAGSGKTFVLSRRVIRLLLAGTAPSRILCLTFTKAAAAEMSNRVFKSLADWTALSDGELASELKDLEGKRPSDEELNRARRLFARALETPGGLKIQTIHAFAEALLHQFPLEANVPAHFEILDDQMAAELLDSALASVLGAARIGDRRDWQAALLQLIDHMGDMDIRDALISLVHDREGFARFMDRSGSSERGSDQSGLQAALANLAGLLAVEPGDDLENLQSEIATSPIFSEAWLRDLVLLFEDGGKRDKDQAILLRRFLATTNLVEKASIWRTFLRKKDGAAKSLSFTASKKVLKAEPGLEDALHQEQIRFDRLEDKRKALITLEMSAALFTLAEGVVLHYEASKSTRGLMDFDDLIIKAAALLKPVNASAWVHYKLDQGIDHILVDEAQDTNPNQWEIIRQLGEEFFTGESARDVDRTIFAVGDEKQSIYSFQGAEPKWFADMRRYFGNKAQQANKPFHDIKLHLSFRSTPHVLKAVDEVFSIEGTYNALSSDKEKTVHSAFRGKDPGMVEIWPLIEPVQQELDDDWARPLDAQAEASPSVQLARAIAKIVKGWLDCGDWMEGSGRPITAGDVLILVRKRGAFVGAVNRALKEEGLPVAGADRLALLDHIAVMDLLSLGDVMLLPQDDLSLAAVLKSPLFGLSEERLFDLAHVSHNAGDGGRTGSLWDALRVRAQMADQDDADLVTIFDQLSRWQGKIDFQPPFDFFAQILGPEGKRRAFVERLGPEADEVIDEFLSRALDFEKNQTPNLQAFLHAMRQGGAEIKRDMAAADGQIRVMTVHGSKGLEAPIVFLVDGTGQPANARHHPHLVPLLDDKGDESGLMAWKAARANQPGAISTSLARLDRDAEEEYLRLLYVGMTRAEDRLYLCGYRGQREPAENCWYEVAKRALSSEAQEVDHPSFETPVLRWQLGDDLQPKPLSAPLEQSVFSSPTPPDWLFKLHEEEISVAKTLQPSRAADQLEESQIGQSGTMGAGLTHGWEPRQRGNLLHALFEHLPSLDASMRPTRGMAYLERMAGNMDVIARQSLLDEALQLIDNPEFSEIFGSKSQAEVSIAGWLDIADERREISGQIDRLIVRDESVLVVDFKTGLNIPGTTSEIPMDYQLQMALYARLLEPLYPDRKVQTLLFWTAGPSFLEVSASQRQEALDQINVSRTH